MKLHRVVHLHLPDLVAIIADKVLRWIYYYGKARMSEIHYVFRFLNLRLAKWVRNKYRQFRCKHWFYAYKWLQETVKQYHDLFEHCKYGFQPCLAKKSRRWETIANRSERGLGVRLPITYSTLSVRKFIFNCSFNSYQ